MSSEPTDGQSIRDQVDRVINRTVQRSVKGLNFIRSGKEPVGLTPKELIYEKGTLRLYHYRSTADEVYRIPLIIVMATTNKSYLFDLFPGQSMVEYLLIQGFDVYMMDWDTPTQQERHLDFADYTQDFIPSCIEKVQENSGEQDVSILGYCMGGVLSAIYAATHADGPLANLACLTTPVNWHEMGLFSHWNNERYFDVDKLVDTVGIIPGDFISSGFDMLRPAQKMASRIRVWDNMWNDDYVQSYRAFDRWGSETVPLAGEYFRQTTKELMWKNKLYSGEMEVAGKSANLANITIPIMHTIAEHDHIVPVAASRPLLELVSSKDKEELVLKGGHVSLIAGPNAVKRMWPNVSQWLAKRSV
ncbi:MAG: polyhydroxyalkanoate synthase [Paraglaciecola psychrophila]|jgi:polyhydroxyalkanoate synthase